MRTIALHHILFFKVSYYFTPVTLLSYFSQNTLHICGAFALVALFLCIVCCFFSGLSLYITSSERLFLNILYVVASHPRPLPLCHKNLFPSTEYLLDPGTCKVCLSLPLECKQYEGRNLFLARIPKSSQCWHIIDNICQLKEL